MVSFSVINEDAPVNYLYSTEYAMIQLKDSPVASYDGDISGLSRTRPEPGSKLDLNTPEAQAYENYLAGKRADAKGWLRDNARNVEVMREYSVAFNGLAVKLNREHPAKLWQVPGVNHVQLSRMFDPMMNISTGLIGAPAVWTALGGQSFAGLGIKIGIIDTGINQTHPFFDPSAMPAPPSGFPKCDARNSAVGIPNTSCNFTTNKVIVARVYQTLTNHDARDQRGHGSHVSGTAAGVAGVSAPGFAMTALSGVAPKAWLGNYNVFPGTGVFPLGGSAFEHDIAMAVEDAVKDGMDVINLSLGGGAIPKDLLQEVVNSAVDAGVVAAVAAGNAGPGAGTISSPGIAGKAITAGASTNPHFLGVPVTENNSPGATFGGALSTGPAFNSTNNVGELDNWDVLDGPGSDPLSQQGRACAALPSGSATGKIVLIRRGICTFATKVLNAAAAGAQGVIVTNSVAGDPIIMGGLSGTPIPAVMVSLANRAPLVAYESANPGTAFVTVGLTPTEIVTPNADFIAGFSSRGPPPLQGPPRDGQSTTVPSDTLNKIKPDVTAPGVNVLSSVIGGCGPAGCWAYFQGTSMATPHVAGSAALLLQANPGWSPDQVKSALVTTAKRPVFHDTTGATLFNPMDRGGGRISLGDANNVDATVSAASISFGSVPPQAGWSRVAPVTLTRIASGSLTYTLSVANMCQFVGGVQTCSASVASPTLSAGAITVSSSSPGTFTATFIVSTSLAVGDYFGDIVISGGSETLTLPYWLRVDQPDPRGFGGGSGARST